LYNNVGEQKVHFLQKKKTKMTTACPPLQPRKEDVSRSDDEESYNDDDDEHEPAGSQHATSSPAAINVSCSERSITSSCSTSSMSSSGCSAEEAFCDDVYSNKRSTVVDAMKKNFLSKTFSIVLFLSLCAFRWTSHSDNLFLLLLGLYDKKDAHFTADTLEKHHSVQLVESYIAMEERTR